jgi:hypothetical protein
MLGFASLAALPLAAASPAVLVADVQHLSGTGAITFAGTASTGAKTHLSATGVLTFSGGGFVVTRVYRSATGQITFGGDPFLKTAGRPIVFTALPEPFVFRGVPE